MEGDRAAGTGGSGFFAAIKSWFGLRRKIANIRPRFTREEIIRQEFDFLERDFGCGPPEVRCENTLLAVTWTTQACRVDVCDDMRDGLDVLVESREVPAWRNQREIFLIKHYREHGNLDDYRRAALARIRPRDFREDLAQRAAWVQEHAADILRGDLSIFPGLDTEYRRILEKLMCDGTIPGSS